MKLKEVRCCGECLSCVDLFGNGKRYCNMKISSPVTPEMDVSTCEVDPDSKPEDCVWDRTVKFFNGLSYEDQLGLKCLSRLFGGGQLDWFEESETVQPTIGKWIRADQQLPTERDWYLGTFRETDTGWVNPIPFVCDYLMGQVTKYTTKDGWLLKDCMEDDHSLEYYQNLECVAWMPLPAPYEEQSAES